MSDKKKAPKQKVVLDGFMTRDSGYEDPSVEIHVQPSGRRTPPKRPPRSDRIYFSPVGMESVGICSPSFRRMTGLIPRPGSCREVRVTIELL